MDISFTSTEIMNGMTEFVTNHKFKEVFVEAMAICQMAKKDG